MHLHLLPLAYWISWYFQFISSDSVNTEIAIRAHNLVNWWVLGLWRVRNTTSVVCLFQQTFMRHHWVHRRRQEGKCKQCGKVVHYVKFNYSFSSTVDNQLTSNTSCRRRSWVCQYIKHVNRFPTKRFKIFNESALCSAIFHYVVMIQRSTFFVYITGSCLGLIFNENLLISKIVKFKEVYCL